MDVIIRKFLREDIPYKVKWINNEKNNIYLHYDLPLTEDKTLEWFNKIKDNKNRADYTILINNTPVGLIGLLNIDYSKKDAEYYICLGDDKYKGKGIAYVATIKLFKIAYNELFLNNIYLYTEVDNIRAQNLFLKIGFVKQEGINQILYKGEKRNRYVYRIDLNNFFKKMINYITPIHKFNTMYNGNHLYIKREDLLPISFGGNKARKAELFFEDIKQKGSDYIVTYGRKSSNHCRIISNLAASNGISCCIISPKEDNTVSFNNKLSEMFGAQIIYTPISNVAQKINDVLKDLKSKGYNPYFIQGGGHGNIGTQAYINVYKEIFDYQRSENIKFDYIFFPSGTGTTQAGLICGKMLNNGHEKIVGISIARKNPYGKQVILESVKSYFESINKSVYLEEINFIDEYILNGYGDYNDNIVNTIKEILKQEGVALDVIYTGKAYWGMIEYLKKNKVTNKNILFVHTGGTPIFFDNLKTCL